MPLNCTAVIAPFPWPCTTTRHRRKAATQPRAQVRGDHTPGPRADNGRLLQRSGVDALSPWPVPGQLWRKASESSATTTAQLRATWEPTERLRASSPQSPPAQAPNQSHMLHALA